jgi:hypothetical protein
MEDELRQSSTKLSNQESEFRRRLNQQEDETTRRLAAQEKDFVLQLEDAKRRENEQAVALSRQKVRSSFLSD